MLLTRKHSLWLTSLHNSLLYCTDHIPSDYLESTLLPRLYQGLRTKPANPEPLIETIVKLVLRDSNSSLINAYTSKISVELSKSSKSYER